MSYDSTDQVLNDLYQQYEVKHSRYMRLFRIWKRTAYITPIVLVAVVVFLLSQFPGNVILLALFVTVIGAPTLLLYLRMAKAESHLIDLGGQITDYQDERNGLNAY